MGSPQDILPTQNTQTSIIRAGPEPMVLLFPLSKRLRVAQRGAFVIDGQFIVEINYETEESLQTGGEIHIGENCCC
jgi:hypothetical protein